MVEPLDVSPHYKWYKSAKQFEHRINQKRYENTYLSKVMVYDDRVMGWFIKLAQSHVAPREAKAEDYISLSVGLAYIEGVAQYREGKDTPRRKSGKWFRRSARKIFGNAPSDEALKRLWTGGRNGLFHCGFTKEKIYLDESYRQALTYESEKLTIIVHRFLEEIIADHKKYVAALRANHPPKELGRNFEDLWDRRWKSS